MGAFLLHGNPTRGNGTICRSLIVLQIFWFSANNRWHGLFSRNGSFLVLQHTSINKEILLPHESFCVV